MALGIVVVEIVPRLASAGDGDADSGDVLVLRFGDGEGAPPAQRAPAAVEGVDFHVVAPGETLSSIAGQLLGDTRLAADLARLNGLSDPNAIEPGQILYLR